MAARCKLAQCHLAPQTGWSEERGPCPAPAPALLAPSPTHLSALSSTGVSNVMRTTLPSCTSSGASQLCCGVPLHSRGIGVRRDIGSGTHPDTQMNKG